MLIIAPGLHLASLEPARDAELFATAVIARVPTAICAFLALHANAFGVDQLVSPLRPAAPRYDGEHVEA